MTPFVGPQSTIARAGDFPSIYRKSLNPGHILEADSRNTMVIHTNLAQTTRGPPVSASVLSANQKVSPRNHETGVSRLESSIDSSPAQGWHKDRIDQNAAGRVAAGLLLRVSCPDHGG